MATQVTVNAALDSALRRGLSEAGARPKPETTMTQIVEALAATGVTAELLDGILVLRQEQTQFNVAMALKGFAAKPENVRFFVTENDNPKNWTPEMRTKYIRENGPDAWARLANGKPLQPAVKVLDRNMGRADYAQLTRQEKLDFIREFGVSAVEKILGRK